MSVPVFLSPATSSLIGLDGRWGHFSSLIGCAVSLHHIRYLHLRIFKFFIVSLFFWPSGFKTVVIVNRRKINRRKPRAACTSHVKVNLFLPSTTARASTHTSIGLKKPIEPMGCELYCICATVR